LLPCQATSGEVELTAAPRSFERVRVEFQELALLRSVWLAMATLLLSVESLSRDGVGGLALDPSPGFGCGVDLSLHRDRGATGDAGTISAIEDCQTTSDGGVRPQ